MIGKVQYNPYSWHDLSNLKMAWKTDFLITVSSCS